MIVTQPTIVFDLDGTLVHTAVDLVNTLNAILVSDGMQPVSYETAVSYVGHGARVLLQRAFTAQGRELPPERLERLFADFIAYYTEHIVDQSAPYPGVDAALDRFQAEGWRMAICTNKSEAPALKLMSLLKMDTRFAAITGADTFGFRKPDPRHLTETIRKAGGDPARAIMVGDSATDVDTALAAGIPVVAVTFGYSPKPVAELGAHRLIDHYDELYDAALELLPR